VKSFMGAEGMLEDKPEFTRTSGEEELPGLSQDPVGVSGSSAGPRGEEKMQGLPGEGGGASLCRASEELDQDSGNSGHLLGPSAAVQYAQEITWEAEFEIIVVMQL
jgi:hypothetical protein